MSKNIIVISIPGLAKNHIKKELTPNICKLTENGSLLEFNPIFPAVTSSVQASILSGTHPYEHGIIANGLYDRKTFKVSFWEQPASLVLKPRIWDLTKLKTAVLFWQNTMFANADVVITPAPIHTEDGKMIEWCYSKPVGLYEEIAKKAGEFSLMSYWGPFTSSKSSEWIIKSADFVLEKFSPDLSLIYIPHLDYSMQRFGPDSREVLEDIKKADELIGSLTEKAKDAAFVILSEYAFTKTDGAISINLLLRKQGFLKVKDIRGKEYIDFENSTAFALVDHQIAHIYVKNGNIENVYSFLKTIKEIQLVMGEKEKKDFRINHERSGELIAVSKPNKWFAYYWWTDLQLAPSFARTVDIHRKPGYDPLELFFDPAAKSISFDPRLIKGSHGLPNELGGEKSLLIINGCSNVPVIESSADLFKLFTG